MDIITLGILALGAYLVFGKKRNEGGDKDTKSSNSTTTNNGGKINPTLNPDIFTTPTPPANSDPNGPIAGITVGGLLRVWNYNSATQKTEILLSITNSSKLDIELRTVEAEAWMLNRQIGQDTEAKVEVRIRLKPGTTVEVTLPKGRTVIPDDVKKQADKIISSYVIDNFHVIDVNNPGYKVNVPDIVTMDVVLGWVNASGAGEIKTNRWTEVKSLLRKV